MNSSENSLYPPDWIQVAEKDWHRMDVMLGETDAEAAGYFLQQSLEKYLKAFLLERGWKLKKIHERRQRDLSPIYLVNETRNSSRTLHECAKTQA